MKDLSKRCHVLYCMAAPAGRGKVFMKIGISHQAEKRLMDIQVACPLKIESIFVLLIGSMSDARYAERAVHSELARYRSNGEWFLFDMRKAEHKAAFNEGCRRALDPLVGAGWKWHELDLRRIRRAIAAAEKERAAKKGWRGESTKAIAVEIVTGRRKYA